MRSISIARLIRGYVLALDSSEVDDLVEACSVNGPIARDVVDAELFVLAYVSSEHCRHEQFNTLWIIDGVRKPYSPFDMIQNTSKKFGVGAS